MPSVGAARGSAPELERRFLASVVTLAKKLPAAPESPPGLWGGGGAGVDGSMPESRPQSHLPAPAGQPCVQSGRCT